MPVNLNQFISLGKAEETFNVSIKTLRRKRDVLRRTDDSRSIAKFVVKTNDGEILERPSGETVTRLTVDGRQPEWLVNLLWLQREYGPRPGIDTSAVADQTPGHDQGDISADQPIAENESLKSDDNLVTRLIAAKDKHIAELQIRLDKAEAERDKMRTDQADERKTLVALLGSGKPKPKHAHKPSPDRNASSAPSPQDNNGVEKSKGKSANPGLKGDVAHTKKLTVAQRFNGFVFGAKSKKS